MDKRYVRVGWLGRSRGIHGDIWVTPDTDFPERFRDLNAIYVRNRDRWEKITIVEASLVGGRPVLRFENVTTPEEAARFTNRELAVTEDELVKLPEGSYYIFDLIGCAVYDTVSDEKIGEIADVERYPANDVYVIQTPDGRRLQCPVTRPFVVSVDIAGRKIVVDRTGLFDEAAG